MSDDNAEQGPRRRGPGFFTVMVLPCSLTLAVVAGFLALTGGLPVGGSSDADTRQSIAGGVNETYGPWLRKAAACTVVAYAVGIDEVTEAGRVPDGARTYLAEVEELLPCYETFDQEPLTGGGPADAILAAPVSTLVITSSYGSRQHPLTGVTKLHTGMDFGAPQGAQVVFAAMTKAYGNRVVIDHGTIDGRRLEPTYSHLSAFDVTTGQTVSTGTSIGRVGSTGLSTGPHLHFEVIYDGYYADPQPWLATN